MALIFWVSSIPNLPGPEGTLLDALLKKLGHLLEYAILAGLLWWALRMSFSLWPGGLYAGALILSLIYAASDELHQALVPGRTARLFDWGVDALGMIAMLAAIKLAQRQASKGYSLHNSINR